MTNVAHTKFWKLEMWKAHSVLYVCVCVSTCEYSDHSPEKKVESLKLELYGVLNHLVLVMESKLGPFATAICGLKCWNFFPAPHCTYFY